MLCSYTEHYAPKQNLVFLQSTLRTHTKFGVHTLKITHPHKIPAIFVCLSDLQPYRHCLTTLKHQHQLL